MDEQPAEHAKHSRTGRASAPRLPTLTVKNKLNNIRKSC